MSTYGAFALAVGMVVVGLLARAWRKGIRQSTGAASSEDLDHIADQLAAAVQAQWQKAAEERGLTGAPIRVTWSTAGNGRARDRRRRVTPVRAAPQIVASREAELTSGQAADLHALYGGLRSGRLIIAGPGGSGKPVPRSSWS